MKLHTLRKYQSNVQDVIELIMIELVCTVSIAMYMYLHGKSLMQVSITVFLMVIFLTICFLLPYMGKLGKCRWRLKMLFELFARTVSFSEKNVFPVVKYGYDRYRDLFVFIFEWRGKVSSGSQVELTHRLSESLFPQNDYLLEEPVVTPAFTKYMYTRKPERLRINYDVKKRDTSE